MIGKNVWMLFGNNEFRCGTIIEQEVCGSWTYAKVDWVDDTGFKIDRNRVKRLRGEDIYSDWYRMDKLHVFDKQSLINKINKL